MLKLKITILWGDVVFALLDLDQQQLEESILGYDGTKKSRSSLDTVFSYKLGTVKVGNFDHLATFKIILKIFPNSFLTIFLHENVRVLWYFWDPNLKTRFGSQKYHIF